MMERSKEGKMEKKEVGTMKIGDVSRLLGISTEAIRKWDREGLLQIERTPLGTRTFTEETVAQILQLIKEKDERRRKDGRVRKEEEVQNEGNKDQL